LEGLHMTARHEEGSVMAGLATDRVRHAQPSGGPVELDRRLDKYRPELTGYCYRMLGSAADAEDAAQETLIRAWRGLDRFEGRSALRSWLYRIATNVCLDMLQGRNRRALPVDISPASPPIEAALGDPLPASSWVEPIPDGHVIAPGSDPADVAETRESIRLAFVAALQHLPARQRAVLILREVLRWQAAEVAELLESTVAAVNSALQRARSTLAKVDLGASRPLDGMAKEDKALLRRYVDAFERYDIESLVALLHEDATQLMPPYPMWLHGRDDIGRWLLGPGIGCRGSRLVPIAANGSPALAQYRRSAAGGYAPFSIQTFEVSAGRITRLTHFVDAGLFAGFGLPFRLER
jgi:RNA polymerase sigma-70 factor, ECF subfamily